MNAAIIDACALINLISSGDAERVLRALPFEVWFQGLVEDEVVSGAAELTRLVDLGLLHSFDGTVISASAVEKIVTDHELGLGEAECLVICQESGVGFVSDDRRARDVARALLDEDNVLGVIGLLCRAIDQGQLTAADAAAALARAQLAGGFLPDFDFERRTLVA